MKLSHILKKLITDNSLSESELARRTGVAQSVIHKILSSENKNPTLSTLKPIADFFCINISQLIGEIPLPVPANIKNSDEITKVDALKLSHVPLIPLDYASQWIKKQTSGAHNFRYTTTDLKMAEGAFAVEMDTAAMEPRFPQGTILIIDPILKPKDADFVLAKLSVDSEIVFRQLFINKSLTYLTSINPFEKQSLIPLNEKDEILGVLVQAKKNYLF